MGGAGRVMPPPPPPGVRPSPTYNIRINPDKAKVADEVSWFDKDIGTQEQEPFINWKHVQLAFKWLFIALGACYFLYKLMGDI